MLQWLVRDGGLFFHGEREYEYRLGAILPLSGSWRHTRVINNAAAMPYMKGETELAAHPEGGYPPKSKYKPGTTIWKWASDWKKKPKTWMEYDRETGFPMEKVIGADYMLYGSGR